MNVLVSRQVLCNALSLVALLLYSTATWATEPIKAFPQAEGFGAIAKGGRGGDVYHVTKLTDDGSVGTLRHGIESAPNASGRTIVFDVGGWIDLNRKLGIVDSKSNITIAGQTAPGGIGVRGHQFSVGADDIIVRHMRFRPGKDAGRVDSVGTNSDAERVIYDHISSGFSFDENFSVQASDVTLQYSTVSFGLESHSAGSLLENPHRLSMHHNLYAHNNTRNPKHRVQETLDWIDNVIYNWDTRAFYMQGTDSSGYFWTSNIDGNYFIAGPNDGGTKPISGGSQDDYGTWWGVNAFDGDKDSAHDGQNYSLGDDDFSDISSAATTWSDTRYPVADEIWQNASPKDAYLRTLSEFGATPWARDEVDQLLYENVVNRTGSIISHENKLVSQGVSNGGFGALGGVAAPLDTDGDGMSDEWEQKHGTNPQVPNNNGDFDHDGYTDLEEYLNDLGAFAAVGQIEFHGIGRYADWQRWDRRWQPSRLDVLQVRTGVAFVDAVGQQAGTLRLGYDAGGDARLYVTSGWLEITNQLVVGSRGIGRVEQYGGELRVLEGDIQILNGAYKLRGGLLATPHLTKAPRGSFEFTGGTLDADAIDFSLTVAGGTLFPGVDAIGSTGIAGDLNMESGTLVIDLESASAADLVNVSGVASLDGNIEVQLLNGFRPTAGQSWQILTARSFDGQLKVITPGFSVEQIGDSLWLVAGTSPSTLAIPEPHSLALLLLGVLGYAANRKCRQAVFALALVAVLVPASGALALQVPVIADSQLSENGNTGDGDANDSGSGTGSPINARFNDANRNEWLALKFDLSEYSDKSRFTDVSLNTYMYRGDANNTQTLRLYALAPGIAGEDWNESTTTYGSMPGFTFDADSQTRLIDGNLVQNLGAFGVSGVTAEGSVASIDPEGLTSFVQSMGNNNLLTLLVTYDVPHNGQWRIASRETTATTTGVLTGAPGDLAPFLDFTLGPVPTTSVGGDYNNNGIVDIADYTVWRNLLGGTSLLNEEVSPNVVDIADYLYWRERFGATDTGEPASFGQPAAVPEPPALSIAGLLAVAVLGAVKYRSRN
ncbi:DNRLRE domain-containing protein [Aeoliella sp. ICT_H6.2]|uniref:DNRLRE domain-containing protein n=1 Tax=Aeoliella straminimaris TaxID=2954799 RepID=A0A9X2F9F9_9BACT|nr:DNRLRE domain-containing protein [Aeoliella straminimaris]MCO6044334.1 DNRLRE domain-containing protein [Aeoliella straminimaris]